MTEEKSLNTRIAELRGYTLADEKRWIWRDPDGCEVAVLPDWVSSLDRAYALFVTIRRERLANISFSDKWSWDFPMFAHRALFDDDDTQNTPQQAAQRLCEVCLKILEEPR